MTLTYRRLPLSVLYALAEQRIGIAARSLQPRWHFPGLQLFIPNRGNR
jgi:hypothetical protein